VTCPAQGGREGGREGKTLLNTDAEAGKVKKRCRRVEKVQRDIPLTLAARLAAGAGGSSWHWVVCVRDVCVGDGLCVTE